MLVLTRKKNQTIMLGDEIKITVLETTSDGAKIGIEAPPNLLILRGELYQAVRDENISALTSKTTATHLLKKIFPK